LTAIVRGILVSSPVRASSHPIAGSTIGRRWLAKPGRQRSRGLRVAGDAVREPIPQVRYVRPAAIRATGSRCHTGTLRWKIGHLCARLPVPAAIVRGNWILRRLTHRST